MDEITNATLPANPAPDGSHVGDIHTGEIEVVHTSDLAVVGENGEVLDAKWSALKEGANKAEEYEHSLSFWASVKEYKAACFWAFVASLSIIMEGYDWTSTSGLWGMYEFRKSFGTFIPSLNDYQAPAPWQSAISQSPSIGSVFGVYWGGYLNDRFGYRKSLIINYIFVIPCIALSTFATNKIMLLMGGFLMGIPFGAFACLGEAFASEICPMSLRGYLTGYVNICWCIGGFVGTGVTVRTQNISSSWAWRIPYMTQWIWPIPLITLTYFAPESPWWLVRHGKLLEAEKSVRRLGSKQTGDRSRDVVANMVRTNQMEMEFTRSVGTSKWLDMFRGTNLRRTEITVMVWLLQQMSGVIFAGNVVFVFEQAGISQQAAFDLGLGTSAIQLFSNFINMVLMFFLGRRTIYLVGFIYSAVNLVVVGVTSIYGDRGSLSARWVQAGFQMAFMVGYTGFLGPSCYAILGEASSTRLRNKTIAFSRMVYAIDGLIFNILNSYMINPSAFNWQGKTAFFWVPFATAGAAWCFYRLPEFKHRSYYEINILFEKKVPARKFKSTLVEVNEEELLGTSTSLQMDNMG